MLCRCFSGSAHSHFSSKVMPIEHILNLDNVSFKKLLKMDEWVFKLFLLFDPFKNKFPSIDPIENEKNYLRMEELRNKICLKISECTDDLSSKVHP